MFTVMNYLMPKAGVLSMHCSANVGARGDTALFFGLSGTGKTTLSADPERSLIGDDEHGWSDEGVFNFEGGCYAKVINLSPEGEPDIYRTTRMFGTVLENVVLDPMTRRRRVRRPVDHGEHARVVSTRLHCETRRERTRRSPAQHRPPDGRRVRRLAARSPGLTPEQAMYYFLSGYTAKVAGTERGVTEPQATFSACFGAVFLVWPATKYATMLGERLARHGSQGLAGQHRVDGWSLRRRQAHAARTHADDGALDPLWRARSVRRPRRIPFLVSPCPTARARRH